MPVDFDDVFSDAFARRLYRALQSVGRFKHEHGRGFLARLSVMRREESLPTSSSETSSTVTGRGSIVAMPRRAELRSPAA